MFAAIGSFAVRRHRWVLAGFGLLLVAVSVLGMGAFGVLKNGGQVDPEAPSSQAEALVDAHFGGAQGLIVLVTADHGTVESPAVAQVGQNVTRTLRSQPGVSQVTSYFGTHAPGLRSSDGGSALILAHVGGGDAGTDARTTTLLATLARDGNGVATVRGGGASGTGAALTRQIGIDLLTVSAVAVPITIVLLYFAFGGFLAALLPLAVSGLAIMGTFTALRGLAAFTPVSTYAIDLTIALGLGLAVDYSLLLINRYREEIDNGLLRADAIVAATATAGRTILFSALTVAVSLTALLAFPLYFLRSFAYAGIAVVVFSVLGALLGLPALLAGFGARAEHRRRGRGRVTGADSPFWRRTAVLVTAAPLRAGLPLVAVLLVVGMPFLHVRFATPDERVLPASAPAHQVGDAVRAQFAAGAADALLVVGTGTPDPVALRDYSQRLSAVPGVSAVQGPVRDARGDAVRWSVDTTLGTTSDSAQNLVRRVRAIGPPRGTTIRVGGPAADLVDQKHSIGSNLPTAGGIILVAGFLLLFLFTGSVLIPLKALACNALTLFAVLGLMVWIFQSGHLSGPLRFTPTATSTIMPPLLFVVAFGLSMDYEVFLISRIAELHDRGVPSREAIVGAMARTGRIVTTAAALLAVTFFAFGLSRISFLQFFGLGTGIAILVDATLVRGILVPAIMTLAGERIWWSPAPLKRLHSRIGLSEVGAHPAAAPATEPDLVTT